MKKYTRIAISIYLVLAAFFAPSTQAFSKVALAISSNTSLNGSDTLIHSVSNITIDMPESEEIINYWYEQLPTYCGDTYTKSISTTALTHRDFKNSSNEISRSIASIQVVRLSNGDDLHFQYWQDAVLTSPITIYNLDETLFGHAYGIVDSKAKLVGYMVTGLSENAPPVLEYSYDPHRFLIMQKATKVYFNSNTGLLIKENDKIAGITGDSVYTASECSSILNEEKTKSKDPASHANIQRSWERFVLYANTIKIQSNTSINTSGKLTTTYSLSNSGTTPTQTLLAMDTSDYTWLTECTYTTMTMYFDAIGRRVEPALMGTARPHSIRLNKTLHSTYGCNPSFSNIATIIMDWAETQKLSPSIMFSNYFFTYDNYICWINHKQQIDKNIPTMVGYAADSGAHITMGIGYTSDEFYIVRDTWTHDGTPLNSTLFYDQDGYTFVVLGLDYSELDSITSWGNYTLRKGDADYNVQRLKILLNLLYYSPGNINSNYFDTETENAVKSFQSDYGLTVDGIVGPATYTKLKNAHIMRYDGNTANWRILSRGTSGDDVAQLQLRLYTMGYLNDTCDGIFDSSTELALKRYQTAKGLTSDGIAGTATFAALYGTNNSFDREYMPCNTCFWD